MRRLRVRRTWDDALGLGRQKIFEVREHYNDVTFIDEFFTEDFCRENQFFSFSMNERSALRDRVARVPQGEGQAPVPADQRWRAVHPDRGRQLDNRGELFLRHRHEAVDLHDPHARASLTALERSVSPGEPAHGAGEQPRMLRFDGKEHSEKSA